MSCSATFVRFGRDGAGVLVRLDCVLAVEPVAHPHALGVTAGSLLYVDGLDQAVLVDDDSDVVIEQLRRGLAIAHDVDFDDETSVQLLGQPHTTAVPPRRKDDE